MINFKSLCFLFVCLGISIASLLFEDCGVAYEGRVFNGRNAEKYEAPWKSAIFRKNDDGDMEYICGGSLISRNVIVTAAHCVHEKRKKFEIEKDKLLVILGATNISDPTEFGRKNFYVKEMFIHTNWSAESMNYNGDIAILKLTSNVKFSSFIQPICVADDVITNNEGKVAAWGVIDDYGNTAETVQVTNLRIVELNECFIKEPLLAKIGWLKSFCGESKTSGVCQGDSGSGIYVKVGDKFFLRGLLSSSIGSRECSEKTIALYSDIPKYIRFIKDKLDVEQKISITTKRTTPTTTTTTRRTTTSKTPSDFHLTCRAIIAYRCIAKDYSISPNALYTSISGYAAWTTLYQYIDFDHGEKPTFRKGVLRSKFPSLRGIKVGSVSYSVEDVEVDE